MMMMIPSELIETLSTVIKEGTFDAAARSLHVTPSAVSQRIKALEQRVGRVLVVRSKPAHATEAGEALLRLGQQMSLLETETLRQLGTERDDERPTTLPIAVNADSLATWILPPLARVAARESIVFDLVRDDQDHTASLLASGAVMAAVASDASARPRLHVDPIGPDAVPRLRHPRLRGAVVPRRAHPVGPRPRPAHRLRPQGHPAGPVRAPPGPASGRPPAPLRPRPPPTSRSPPASAWAGRCSPQTTPAAPLETGELVDLAPGRHLDVPLHWQQWNLRSSLIDAVAAEVKAEAARALH